MSIVPNSLNQINELMQGGQISSGVQFDLTDDTFAKILGNKLNQAEESGESSLGCSSEASGEQKDNGSKYVPADPF